jgi:multidrug efflux pump subunit AcrB
MEALLVADGGYTRALRWSLGALAGGAGDAGLGGGSWWLFTTAKSELAPMEDRGVIAMPVRAPDGATLEYTARYLDAIDAIAAPTRVRPPLHVHRRRPGVERLRRAAHRGLGPSATAPRRSWRANCCPS